MEGKTGLEAALSKPVVPAINGLRAIAILMLVGGHYSGRSPNPSVQSLGTLAGYSIVLLFVLTGFIVTHILLREFSKPTPVKLTSWYLSKALRLYPTLIAILLVTNGVQIFNEGFEVPVPRYVGFLSLAGNYYYALAEADTYRHGLGHLWSLMVGAHFLIPWVMILRAAVRKNRIEGLVGPLAVIVVVSAVLRAFLGQFTGVTEAYLYLSTETRVGEIALGALVAVAVNTRPLSVPSWISSRPSAALGFIVLVASLVWTSPVAPTLRVLSTALLLLYFISLNGAGPARILDHPRLGGISLISYSVFTWHVLGLDFDGLLGFLPWAVRVPTVVTITLGLGAITFVLLEWPARSLAKRLRTAPVVLEA